MRPEPVCAAVEAVLEGRRAGEQARLVLLTPAGRRFDQRMADQLSRGPDLVLVCGHYEGFDERISGAFPFEEISIGDFVMTGGEVPALAVLDAVVRLLPGVLGDPDSASQDSFASGLLEHPHYTRPSVFRGMAVPEVLLSGDHERIRRWRRDQALVRTRARRADLLPTSEAGAVGGGEYPITSRLESGGERIAAGPNESNLERG